MARKDHEKVQKKSHKRDLKGEESILVYAGFWLLLILKSSLEDFDFFS